MERPELYQKTVDILVQAYFNDTLTHFICTSCAVGNLIAPALGYSFGNMELMPSGHGAELKAYCWIRGNEIVEPMEPAWWRVIHHGIFCVENYHGEAKRQIDATGYTPRELILIEQAFENVPVNADADKWMFNGLMAVVEALDQIHENTDAAVTQTSKQRFVKTPTL